MALLADKINVTVEELEENLGEKKLPEFIRTSEEGFIGRIDKIVDMMIHDTSKKAIFVAGPTSSGKTTFTMRLSAGLSKAGRKAAFLSLDDYYILNDLQFDRQGRPDFETIDTLDIDRAYKDIHDIIDGKSVIPPFFDFTVRRQMERDPSEAIKLPEDGVLVVEGLHGLNKRVSGDFNDEIMKVFIMPYGNVFSDRKLMDSQEIRLLRRIVRDNRHRASHAIATIDYWPMIAKSEEHYYTDYLEAADHHVNSFLSYESLIIAPLALQDINDALRMVEEGTLPPNVFMERSNTGKDFADLSAALAWAGKLVSHLNKIPKVDPSRVPSESILNEFISK
ncbi:MAG: hypothetical protein IJ757_00115 [Clostridiales bacterium]|nr:hypothetical protein [Clostridiales bacterium]